MPDEPYSKTAFQDPARWEKIKDTTRRWWSGELDRPLIQIYLQDAEPDRPEPKLRNEGIAGRYGFDVPAEAIVDRWDYELSRQRFLGDAFPHAWPNYGPGVAAAFLGADLMPHEDTTWFKPREIRDVADLHFRYDPNSRWLHRLKDVCRAAVDRWRGSVQVGMTDLGGAVDIVSTFRPSELLPVDLIEYPDDVKRLIWEAHELWWRYFSEIDSVLQAGGNPGYSSWTTIFSEVPYYMLQCDFCYMIGPGMFDDFVKPELTASCRGLTNPFYHLDGIGQLRHLDSLLGIEELKGVQWIPGSGQPEMDQWPEVYRKIHAAGKLIQLFDEPRYLDAVVDQIGTGRGLILITRALDASRVEEAEEFLRKYDAL